MTLLNNLFLESGRFVGTEKTRHPDSMSDQDIRRVVCQVIMEWAEQPQAVAPLLERSLNSEPACNQVQRALATNLTSGVIRWQRRLDHYIDRLLTKRKMVQPEVRNILRLALFELEFPNEKSRPEYAVVSQAVNLTKIIAPGRDGFVNGILRSFLRHDPADLLPEDNNKPRNLAIRYSLPVWLVKKWQADCGPTAAKILCRKANHFQGTTFRSNQMKISREEFLESFADENDSEIKLEKGMFSENAFNSMQAAPLLNSKWFHEGFISVQDEGAQLIAELLNPQPGEIILDACAAPGGKGAYMAELSNDQATIIAADSEPERLLRISETGARLELNSIKPVCTDLTKALPPELPQAYDAILVDVPCSGLGVIRRRADLRWRKSLKESTELATIQLQILTNCSKYLKIGGRIIYATCTTCRNENQDVVAEFLARNRNFRIIPQTEIEPERLQKLINCDNFLETSFIEGAQMDGFFAAMITRTS
ncbi:MAG: hypothetical protein DRH03_10155 [Deltaproteobacteria bacterium]|nr:MAG: hypothetical protein DRH03_10155 [Deltaproteobacteria bacterium]